jgi:competence protein ComEC
MRGKVFFINTSAFTVGILFQTLFTIPWQFTGLGFFLGTLCLLSYGIEKNLYVLILGTICICCSFGIVRTSFATTTIPSEFKSLLNKSVSIEGTIVADPDIREKNQQLIVETYKESSKTLVLVFAPVQQHFIYGERIRVVGVLSAPGPFVTDSGRVFRYDSFLKKKGIFSVIVKAKVSAISAPRGFLSLGANILFTVKHTFVVGLARALPNPYNDLATGLLTGDQHQLGDTLVNTLAVSGLIWVVVLSGYHVTLIAEAILSLFGFLPKRYGYMLAALGIIAVVFATGGSAPSLRGGAMACFTLFARGSNRTYDAIRALCAALILILLWNPYLLAYDSGFQLSIVVTPALILGTPILERHLLWIPYSFIREILAVSVVAQFACLPLILWQTGQLGLWSILANMFVMPLVPVSMLSSFVAGVTGAIAAPLAPLFALPSYAILYYILAVATISSTLPLASIILPAFSFAFVIIMYALLIGIFFCLTPPR